MKCIRFLAVLSLISFAVVLEKSFAQAELTAWGNLGGMRIDGQLMKFTSSICLVGPSMADITETAKERQRPIYTRKGNKQIVTTDLSQFSLTEKVQDAEQGTATIDVAVKAAADTTLTGVFVCFELPADDYAGVNIQLIDSAASMIEPVPLLPARMGKLPASFGRELFLCKLRQKAFAQFLRRGALK